MYWKYFNLALVERKEKIFGDDLDIFLKINSLHDKLDREFISVFNRSLPFNETLFDRWERARKLNFGEGSSIYDSALVFGNVIVGSNSWIGPFTIIDGSGGLEIGNHCTISVGVQIYTHDNVFSTLTSGRLPIERHPVIINDNVYIGPNSIITKGVSIGNFCVIGAGAFVNKSFDDNSLIIGQPARKVANIIIENNIIKYEYLK